MKLIKLTTTVHIAVGFFKSMLSTHGGEDVLNFLFRVVGKNSPELLSHLFNLQDPGFCPEGEYKVGQKFSGQSYAGDCPTTVYKVLEIDRERVVDPIKVSSDGRGEHWLPANSLTEFREHLDDRFWKVDGDHPIPHFHWPPGTEYPGGEIDEGTLDSPQRNS